MIQAALGDRRAAASIDEVRRLGVDAFHLNRGLIAFAQAVLEGRAGRPGRADAIVAGYATAFANCGGMGRPGPFHRRPPCPGRWLGGASPLADRHPGPVHQPGTGLVVGRCAELLGDASPNPWAGEGVPPAG